MRIKTHLGNVLYLSFLQSVLITQSEESQSENRLSSGLYVDHMLNVFEDIY